MTSSATNFQSEGGISNDDDEEDDDDEEGHYHQDVNHEVNQDAALPTISHKEFYDDRVQAFVREEDHESTKNCNSRV